LKKAADYTSLLQSGRWFGALPADFRDSLLSVSALRTCKPEERLFERGDPPAGLFAVLDGRVRISAVGANGKEALLLLMEPPQWFGEISIIDGLPMTHDATAEVETLVVHSPLRAVKKLLEQQPQHWQQIALLVSGKMRLAFLAMEEAALLPAPARVARRLVWIAEGYGEFRSRTSRVINLKQDQLGAMLSMSRQTANQVLKDLESRGLIKLTYREIEILDLKGLKLAAGAD
jgi:CRP/FNR family cyclic AMP-dependent transcriptional regulator